MLAAADTDCTIRCSAVIHGDPAPSPSAAWAGQFSPLLGLSPTWRPTTFSEASAPGAEQVSLELWLHNGAALHYLDLYCVTETAAGERSTPAAVEATKMVFQPQARACWSLLRLWVSRGIS